MSLNKCGSPRRTSWALFLSAGSEGHHLSGPTFPFVFCSRGHRAIFFPFGTGGLFYLFQDSKLPRRRRQLRFQPAFSQGYRHYGSPFFFFLSQLPGLCLLLNPLPTAKPVAKPSPTPKSVTEPRLISTLTENLTLAVLDPDSKGRIILGISDLVVLGQCGVFSALSVSVLFVSLATHSRQAT